MSTSPPAQTAAPPQTPHPDTPNSRISPDPDAPAPPPPPQAQTCRIPRVLMCQFPSRPPPSTAIVTAAREKHPRHQKGQPKARPGRLPWKYGYHLADDQDLAEDVEDPPDEAVDEVVHDVMSPEEQEFCAQYTKKTCELIGAWYRAQYGSLLQSDKTAFQELFTGVLDGAPPKPQRGRLLHFYSRKFYDSRIKEDAEERMVSLTRRAELAGEAAPKRIDVIAKVTAECWEQETVEFQSFANTAFYLQPFIDAIQQQFGMCVTVLLAGPIGEWDGKIGEEECRARVRRCPDLGAAAWRQPPLDWGPKRGGRHCLTPKGKWAAHRQHPHWRGVWRTERGEGVGREKRETREEGARRTKGGERENRGDGACGAVGPHDELWQHDDHADWTPELTRAHAAFETGREWGGEWAACVQKFFDFKAVWGYDEGSWKMATKYRPRQVDGVAEPGEEMDHATGARRPAGEKRGDWPSRGVVMAVLVWWGEVVWKRGEEQEQWLVTVRDITWVLEQLLKSGEIDRDEGEEAAADGPAKKKNGKSAGSAAKKLVAETHRGNRRKHAEEGEGDGEEDGEEEPRPKKRSQKATVPEVPRRAARLRGADPEDSGGRRTRGKTGRNAAKGKRADRPKPKPLYRGKGKN
ncbi:hypothetical protein B0H14DRAFT_3604655 [Mycena olivaceomarginata]|nr:hypothetical protein B0H14DRAFT_3604655 [Mycena olivaceomarginata]